MGRQVDVDQLVSARTITERLGYRKVQIVHRWRRTDDSFPAAVFRLDGLRGVRVWYWPDVEAWAVATGRMGKDGTPRPDGVRPKARGRKDTEAGA